MTKEEIGNILKQLRVSSGKTQKEVAKILGRNQQVVGHWETGYSQPDANTLFTLCDIYGTTVDEAFGFKKGGVSIFDLKFLERYHSLDDIGKTHVNYVLDWESGRIEQLKEKSDRITELEETINTNNIVEMPASYQVSAAHERTDIKVTDEMRKYDDDIMMDDSEWE